VLTSSIKTVTGVTYGTILLDLSDDVMTHSACQVAVIRRVIKVKVVLVLKSLGTAPCRLMGKWSIDPRILDLGTRVEMSVQLYVLPTLFPRKSSSVPIG
jgi:hypothetical protein